MEMKQLCKNTLFRLIEKSGLEAVRDSVWARRGSLPAAILVFHRVTDEIPEGGITISTHRFRTVVKIIKEHYRPVSLADLIGRIRQKDPWPERTIAVTFDDGYDDNLEFAAPILQEYGIPATFFITVEMIGTNHLLPWDEHLAGRIRWMTWDQVRLLRSKGFEIGSHTLTHCDLGKGSGEEARREIWESKRRLEDALGAGVSLFAYPFGGTENMLAENRNLVREAGYNCCCSAFGGFVTGRSDPFELRRIPIDNWYTTPADLHCELRIVPPWKWFHHD